MPTFKPYSSSICELLGQPCPFTGKSTTLKHYLPKESPTRLCVFRTQFTKKPLFL